MHANFMWSSQQAVIIYLHRINPLVFSIAEGLCSLWVRIWIFINYWISIPNQGVKTCVRNHVPVSKWLFIQHTPVSSETRLHSRCTLSRWFVTYKDVRRCKDCRVWTGTSVRPQLCRDLGAKLTVKPSTLVFWRKETIADTLIPHLKIKVSCPRVYKGTTCICIGKCR